MDGNRVRARFGFPSRYILVPVIIMIASMISGLMITSTANAITHIGPTDTNTRYAMEWSDSTQATTISVPVYFPAQPVGPKTVQVNNMVIGAAGLVVRFNGGAIMTGNGSFTIPAGNFTYDPVAGLWRASISAVLTGYGAYSWDNYLHFRLQLSDSTGYIAYGGGRFNAAPNGFPTFDKTTPNTYSLYMATPCDITVNTAQTVRFYDLDHEHLRPENSEARQGMKASSMARTAHRIVHIRRKRSCAPVQKRKKGKKNITGGGSENKTQQSKSEQR